MLNLIGFGVRGLLLLSGAVVLGLSVTLAKNQVSGSPPAETSFGTFAGAFGILASLIGIAAIFVEAIPGIIILGIDALASVFYLAGGIALTLALKGVSCTDDDPYQLAYGTRRDNKLLNGGCDGITDKVRYCGVDLTHDDFWGVNNELKARCTRVQADYAFEFISCAFGIGAVFIGFMLMKNRGSHF